MRFGRKQVLSLLLLIAVTSGCTSSHGERPEPVQPTSAWKPADGPVHLDCDDGLTGPDLLTDETKLTDTVGSGLLESVSQLPHAGRVGILAPSEEWYFRKAPIFVASGSPTVTLNVPEDGWQYLMWTSEEAWTAADGDHVNGAWATTQVAITACHSLTTSFFGGLLVKDPTRCFTLSIREEGKQAETLSIRGGGSVCA